jgi:hypothetical protein
MSMSATHDRLLVWGFSFLVMGYSRSIVQVLLSDIGILIGRNGSIDNL